VVLGAFTLVGLIAVAYIYTSYSALIDTRLSGERTRTLPRIYARPFELRSGQSLTTRELVARLNDLGYVERAALDEPGQFVESANIIELTPREGRWQGRKVRIRFPAQTRNARGAQTGGRGVLAIEVTGPGGARLDSLDLGATLLTALMTSGDRQKRRSVPLSAIPLHAQQAVLAIEDQGFYYHPGINPVRMVGALLTNTFGDNAQPVGGSTITQQLARMFFLADAFNAELQSGTRGRSWESYFRKAQEMVMSLVLERHASKDEILEMYLNDMYLGNRGSFAIHGVAEAARIFFGKDVANISVAEAALIAGVIQNPGLRSPFANPKRSVERRNIVVDAMVRQGAVSEEDGERAKQEAL
jgi:penicillin-binding protein 1B